MPKYNRPQNLLLTQSKAVPAKLFLRHIRCPEVFSGSRTSDIFTHQFVLPVVPLEGCALQVLEIQFLELRSDHQWSGSSER